MVACGPRAGGPTPGPGEVLVAGGTFVMGHTAIPMTHSELVAQANGACGFDPCANYAPPRRVTLPPYFIDRYPVTVADYIACVKASRCEYPLGADPSLWGENGERAWKEIQRPAYAHLPMAIVNHEMMVEYCGWRGKRLPTEAEWEHAARGPDDWDYPWGPDLPTCPEIPEMCPDFWKTHPGPGMLAFHGLYPVGSVPKDRTPSGIYDLYGDGDEEVSDYYGTWTVAGGRSIWNPQGITPTGPDAGSTPHVVKAPGGLFNTVSWVEAWGPKRGIPMWSRNSGPGQTFRCARSVPKQEILP